MSGISEKKLSAGFWILFGSMATISVCLAVISVLKPGSEIVRALIISSSRQILAKAEADLTGNGDRVAVLKVKTADSLSLEIFEMNPTDQSIQFVRRLVLPEKRDGHLSFRGNAANLIITDVDGDNLLEIVTPTFDDNLVPRLHVYKYQPDTKDFVKLGPDSINL